MCHVFRGFSFVPQHTVSGLVSYLYPFGGDAFFFQCSKYIAGMFGYGILEFVQRICIPCSRFSLLSRICPTVAVMKINHQSHTQLMSTPGFYQYIAFITPTVGGIHPYTQSDGIHSQFAEQSYTFRFASGRGIELGSGFFHFGEPAYIGSFGKSTHVISRCFGENRFVIITASSCS